MTLGVVDLRATTGGDYVLPNVRGYASVARFAVPLIPPAAQIYVRLAEGSASIVIVPKGTGGLSAIEIEDIKDRLEQMEWQNVCRQGRLQAMSNVEIEEIKDVPWGNRRFAFRHPARIRIRYEDGVWTHEWPELEILSYGVTRTESEEAFREDFVCCWDSLVLEDDSALTGDAQELKRQILDVVGSIETIAS